MGSLVRKLLLVTVAAAGALAVVTGSAPAAPISLDLEVRIIATNDQNGFSYSDGQTVTVKALKFFGGVRVLGISGADMSVATVRIELPSGLSWGANAPKPSRMHRGSGGRLPEPSGGCQRSGPSGCRMGLGHHGRKPRELRHKGRDHEHVGPR